MFKNLNQLNREGNNYRQQRYDDDDDDDDAYNIKPLVIKTANISLYKFLFFCFFFFFYECMFILANIFFC